MNRNGRCGCRSRSAARSTVRLGPSRRRLEACFHPGMCAQRTRASGLKPCRPNGCPVTRPEGPATGVHPRRTSKPKWPTEAAADDRPQHLRADRHDRLMPCSAPVLRTAKSSPSSSSSTRSRSPSGTSLGAHALDVELPHTRVTAVHRGGHTVGTRLGPALAIGSIVRRRGD